MRFSRLPVMPGALLSAFVLVSAVAATAQTTSIPARITEVVDVEKFVTLRGNTHPLARPEFDRGAAPDSLPALRIMLVLSRAPEQEAALRKLMDEQQIKSSPNFHQWLTPEEFGKQFGPADSDIQTVADWLTTQGFQVNQVTAGRTVIEFSGTAGQVRQALHTEIHKFVVNGQEHWANASDPQIPAALTPVVAGIASLNNFPRKSMSHRLGTFSRSKVTGEVRPLFTYGSFPPNYAVGPTDFATIYNVLPLWAAGLDGTGQSIAVVGTSNINIQDVQHFRTMFGLPANDPQIILDGPDPGINSFTEGEADLDVQWAGAVAKNATIKLVVSADTETSFGDDLSSLYIVDNNLAPVMSDSFGACENQLGSAGNAFYNSLWEQAAAQGITVFVASGDSGSAGCDDPNSENAAQFGLAVDGLASTPFNVAIGGTDFNNFPAGGSVSPFWNPPSNPPAPSSAKSYIPEVPWNDSCAAGGSTTGCASVSSNGNDLAGGSGGPSAVYAKPSWQTGTGVPNDGVRDLPDVSLFGADGLNGSFYVYCQADANTGAGSSTTSCDLGSPFLDFQGAGGTSFGAPAFAGILALVNQKMALETKNPGVRQGNANYVLYPLAAKAGASCTSNAAAVTNNSCIFYDTISGINSATGAVTATGNISVACQGGTPNCSNPTSGGFGVLVNPSNSSLLAWTTTAGYDLATGLGTVNATNLVNNWASVTGTFKPTTTTLAISPTTIIHGQSVNMTINVTSTSSGTPTGDVSLIGGPNNSALGIDFAQLSGGAISGTTTFLPGGTYGVTAHYAGDGAFGASDSTPAVNVVVTPEPSQTHLGLVTFDLNGNVIRTSATTAAYGSPYVFRVDVTNASGQICAPSALSEIYPCPTGTVTLTDNGALLDGGTFALNSQGYTEDILIQLPAGSHNLLAAHIADLSFGASTSAADSISITKAATTLALTASPSPVQTGANVTLTAVVNTQSNGAVPGGTVQFLNGITPISGTVSYLGIPYPTSTSGSAALQATLVTTFSSAATLTITAQYSGDSNYASSPAASTTVTVTAVPEFNFIANPASFNIARPGLSGTTTLTVSPINGFTGTANFTCAVPTAMKEAGCSLAPTSVTTSGTTTLKVTTTASHIVGGLANRPDWFLFGGGALMACLLLLSIPVKRRRLNWALGLMCVAVLAAGAFGCGGGSTSGGGPTTDPGTALGTYTVRVTATSGTLSNTVNVSVTVQ